VRLHPATHALSLEAIAPFSDSGREPVDRSLPIGVDRAPVAIAAAQSKGEGRGNLRFLEGDPAEMNLERLFDAVVGRYVLMFQEHPATMLHRLASHLRSEGLLALHELDYEGISSFPLVPTFDKLKRWNAETTLLYGADPHTRVRRAERHMRTAPAAH